MWAARGVCPAPRRGLASPPPLIGRRRGTRCEPHRRPPPPCPGDDVAEAGPCRSLFKESGSAGDRCCGSCSEGKGRPTREGQPNSFTCSRFSSCPCHFVVCCGCQSALVLEVVGVSDTRVFQGWPSLLRRSALWILPRVGFFERGPKRLLTIPK